MGLIEDYESLIVSIKNISTEIPELQEQITVYEREIAEAQNNKAQLQMERSHQSTSLRESKLQELTSELCSKISYEQSQITQKLSEIDSEFSKASNAIKGEEYRDKFVRFANKDSANARCLSLQAEYPGGVRTDSCISFSRANEVY